MKESSCLHHISTIYSLNDCLTVTDFSMPSSVEDYKQKAKELVRKSLFKSALRMYLAAGDDEGARYCEAMLHLETYGAKSMELETDKTVTAAESESLLETVIDSNTEI